MKGAYGKGLEIQEMPRKAIARWQVRVAIGVFSIAIEFSDFVSR